MNKFNQTTTVQMLIQTAIRKRVLRAVAYIFTFNFFLLGYVAFGDGVTNKGGYKVALIIIALVWNLIAPFIYIKINTFYYWRQFCKYNKIDRKLKLSEFVTTTKVKNLVISLAGGEYTSADTKGFITFTQKYLRNTYMNLFGLVMIPVLLMVPTLDWILIVIEVAVLVAVLIYASTYTYPKVKQHLSDPGLVFLGADVDALKDFAKKPLSYKLN